jgi:hypothetical protein
MNIEPLKRLLIKNLDVKFSTEQIFNRGWRKKWISLVSITEGVSE